MTEETRYGSALIPLEDAEHEAMLLEEKDCKCDKQPLSWQIMWNLLTDEPM